MRLRVFCEGMLDHVVIVVSQETNEEPQAPGSQEKRIRNSVLLRVPM